MLEVIIDLINRKNTDFYNNIYYECMHDNCHCEDGILKFSINHTLNITLYLFLTTLIINFLIYFICVICEPLIDLIGVTI